MAQHPSRAVADLSQVRAAASPSLTEQQARELVGSSPLVRVNLAASAHCPLDVLAVLASDLDLTVRTSALTQLLSRSDVSSYLPAVHALAEALSCGQLPLHLRSRIGASHLLPPAVVSSALAADSALAQAVAERSGERVISRPPRRPEPGQSSSRTR